MKHIKPNGKSLYVSVALFSLTINIYFTALPFYLQKIGKGSSELGIAFAIYFFCYLALCLHQNKTTNRPPKKVISSIIIVLIAILFVFEIIQSLKITNILYLFSAMLGLTQASLWPILMAKVASNGSEKELDIRLSRFNLSWAIPMLISPVLAALFLSKSIIYVSLVITLLLFSLLLTLSKIELDEKINNTPCSKVKATHSKPSILIWAAGALISASLVIMLYKTHLAQFMTSKLGFSESSFAIAVSFANLGTVFIFFMQRRWHQWQWQKSWIMIGQIIAIIAVTFVFTKSFFFIIVGAFLAGMSHGFMYGAHQFYTSKLTSNNLQAMSKHEIVQSGGIITGSLLAGFAGEISFSMPYLITLVVTTSMLLLLGLIGRKPQSFTT